MFAGGRQEAKTKAEFGGSGLARASALIPFSEDFHSASVHEGRGADTKLAVWTRGGGGVLDLQVCAPEGARR